MQGLEHITQGEHSVQAIAGLRQLAPTALFPVHQHNDVAPQIINLPPVTAALLDITMRGVVANDNPVTFNAAALNVIQGPNTITQAGFYTLKVINGNSWLIQFIPLLREFTDLTDTPDLYTGAAGQRLVVTGGEDGVEFEAIPPRLMNIMFSEAANLVAGQFMNVGGVITNAADIGWVAPVAGTITEVGLGMNNAASSALDINVNGVSQTSLPVTLSKHTFSISVPFVAGDVITVNNDALGSQLNNTILNMMIEV